LTIASRWRLASSNTSLIVGLVAYTGSVVTSPLHPLIGQTFTIARE